MPKAPIQSSSNVSRLDLRERQQYYLVFLATMIPKQKFKAQNGVFPHITQQYNEASLILLGSFSFRFSKTSFLLNFIFQFSLCSLIPPTPPQFFSSKDTSDRKRAPSSAQSMIIGKLSRWRQEQLNKSLESYLHPKDNSIQWPWYIGFWLIGPRTGERKRQP